MSDDAYIIAVVRTLAARDERVLFHETEVTEGGGFMAAASIMRPREMANRRGKSPTGPRQRPSSFDETLHTDAGWRWSN